MPETTKEKILALLKEGKYASQIANALKLTPPTVTGHLKRLQAKGLIQLDKYSSSKYYHLTEKGLAYLLDNAKPCQPVATQANPSSLQKLRIHSLALAFELKDKLGKDEPQRILQSKGVMQSLSGLKNQLSAYTQDALLTPSSLIIYMPELSFSLSMDPRLALQPYISMAMQKALDYEQRLGIRLKRLDRDTLHAKIIMNHNANTDNAIARKVLDSLNKFEVRDEEGLLRLVIDNSGGIPEFEAVDSLYAIEDITKVEDLYLAALQGRFDYRKEQELIQGLIHVTANNTKGITEFHKWLAHHDAKVVADTRLMDRVTRLIDELREERRQRIL